ncbi:MAG: STAS domain-containing protein [Candidatus Coatesbacteria bacterium]|nr:STAS domain-containing protein [Candidatus Coatesbacteria bacterium]
MTIETEFSPRSGVKIIRISGRIEHTKSRELQEVLKSAIVGEHPYVAADMSQVRYMDSSALGIFVSALKSARSRGGDLRISGLADMVLDVFRITRLSMVFQIYANIDEAIASFSAD